MVNKYHGVYGVIFSCILALSCSTPGPAGLFAKKSLHDQYGDNIIRAGLKETGLGKLWFDAAERSLSQPLSISLPYSETGYFSAAQPAAAGLTFPAKRGQNIRVNIAKKPVTGFAVYLDLWQAVGNAAGQYKFLLAANSATSSLTYEVKEDGNYIIRIQPELLRAGEYTLTITTAPSLAFPAPAGARTRIASFWGANRDAGARRHEGIDIMVPFRTPLLAAANGVITGVNENKLGGKVVFLNPNGRDYTLYYAHLDEQLVSAGQSVNTGDTIGLAGTTGNAKGGPPHLHFGIYTSTGAIDPITFVDPFIKEPPKITAPLDLLGKPVRVSDKTARIYRQPVSTASDYITAEGGELLKVEAASASWYKVATPNGQAGYIRSAAITSLQKPLRKYNLSVAQPLFDMPDTSAARKKNLPQGQPVNVLATWKNYYFVQAGEHDGWLLRNML